MAPDEAPVIVSAVVKVPVLATKLIGLVVSIILPVAPVEEPVIFSPLVNVPVTVPTVNSGADASADALSESYTAIKLNTSARPREIVLSVGLVPKA